MNVLIYDLEIIKCIPPKDGVRKDEFEYCDGWTAYTSMGISVCGWGWLDSELTYVFDWADKVERNSFLDAAKFADVVAGFNSRNFDDYLLKANGVELTTEYDILEEVRLAAFGSTRWQDTPKGCSYSLDAITKANGMAKTGNGALAPELWQRGFRQDVLDYCRNDVIIERGVMRLLLDGKLVDPNTGRILKGRPLMAEVAQ